MLGRRITAATLLRRDILVLPKDPAGGFSRSRIRKHPARVRPEHLLVAGTVVELRRRGKQLAIIVDDGRALVVHLGMTGQLRYQISGESAPETNHVHAMWTFADGSSLLFRDPRRFGGLWFVPESTKLNQTRWADLGRDALTITGPALHEAASESKRAIKAVLLDQRILAGVGNIYADEALFLARIAPRRRATRLSSEQFELLAAAIRQTLANAVALRGSTLRDYRDGTGQPGEAQLKHQVYGRTGQRCNRCGKALKTLLLAQRTTVWCPECQT